MSAQSEFVIKQLGGNRSAAEFFGVTPGAISQWVGDDLPPARWLELLDRAPEIFWAAKSAAKVGSGDTAQEPMKEAA